MKTSDHTQLNSKRRGFAAEGRGRVALDPVPGRLGGVGSVARSGATDHGQDARATLRGHATDVAEDPSTHQREGRRKP